MLRLSFLSLLLVSLIQNSYSKYIQVQELIGTGFVQHPWQGYSISLSANGDTLAVGAFNDSNAVGATWIFTQSSTDVWTQHGNKLVGTGYVGKSKQAPVSLSADGKTLAVGGFNDDNGVGATWIFNLIGGKWIQHGVKIVADNAIGAANQGYSVALNGDGTILAIGGIADNNNHGATWIYQLENKNWVQKAKLTPTNGVRGQQGTSVSISYDGSIVVSGSPFDGSGSVYVYQNKAGSWSSHRLVASDATAYAAFGSGVSISSEGNAIAVGGYNDSNGVGAAWVFTSSSGWWSQAGSKLVGTGYVGTSNQGWSVAINAQGTVLAVGGKKDNNGAGATWVFTSYNGWWTQYESKLIGVGEEGGGEQGFSVAISSDGTTLASGTWCNNGTVGAVFVYTNIVYPFAGPVSLAWLFNGNALDASGNGNNAVTESTTYETFYQAGQPNNEALLTKGYVVTSAYPVWFGSKFTIQIIFSINDLTPDAFSDSFSLIDLVSSTSILAAVGNQYGNLYFVDANGSQFEISPATNRIAKRTTYDLVISVDGSSIQIWLNSNSLFQAGGLIFTPGYYYLYSNFHGYIDQIVVY